MRNLFNYVKNKNELTLIKSCVFHYELEFIHPFTDGNGRMGRLWQTLILIKDYPIFEFLPFETLISKNQSDYYRFLSLSDKEGKSTKFIQFLLQIINQSLEDLLQISSGKLTAMERLEFFLHQIAGEFTRKDYMKHYPEIASATASRDLANGVTEKKIIKIGDKKTSRYKKR